MATKGAQFKKLLNRFLLSCPFSVKLGPFSMHEFKRGVHVPSTCILFAWISGANFQFEPCHLDDLTLACAESLLGRRWPCWLVVTSRRFHLHASPPSRHLATDTLDPPLSPPLSRCLQPWSHCLCYSTLCLSTTSHRQCSQLGVGLSCSAVQ